MTGQWQWLKSTQLGRHSYPGIYTAASKVCIPTPTVYYPQLYFKACDLLAGALEERFNSQRISTVLAIESALLNAVNGEVYSPAS